METDNTPQGRDYRLAALLAMTRCTPTQGAHRVLQRHPDWARLENCLGTPEDTHGSLPTERLRENGNEIAEAPAVVARILEEELDQLESAMPVHWRLPPAARGPACYALRRRLLADWLELDRAAEIPVTWRDLAVMDAERMNAVFEAIGVTMITAAVVLEPAVRVASWLKPLGKRLARRVVDRIRCGPISLPGSLLRHWHDAYGELTGNGRGAAIPRRLGQALVSGLLRHLHPAQRQGLLPFLGTRLVRPLLAEVCPPQHRAKADELLRFAVASQCVTQVVAESGEVRQFAAKNTATGGLSAYDVER